MKNTMKIFAVTCFAALTLIGQKNIAAETIAETQDLTGNHITKAEQSMGSTNNENNPDNDGHVEWVYIEDLLQDPTNPPVLSLPITNTLILADSKAPTDEPKIETPKTEQEEPAVSISNKEKDLLARLVEAEAKGESYEGKVAVATVVLNRVDSPQFPDTIKEVVYQEVGGSYAFSPVQNGSIKKPASDEATRAVEESLMRKDRLNNSIYFYNPEIATDNWIRTRNVVTTIGHHVFAK